MLNNSAVGEVIQSAKRALSDCTLMSSPRRFVMLRERENDIIVMRVSGLCNHTALLPFVNFQYMWYTTHVGKLCNTIQEASSA